MYFMYMLYWKWAMYNVYAWYDYVNSITAMGLASFFKLLTVPLKWYRGSIDFKRNRHNYSIRHCLVDNIWIWHNVVYFVK